MSEALGRPQTDHVPALDGLRAVAVTLVVVHHLAQFPARARATGLVGNVLFGFGRLGVVLFMVLSGFVIWQPVSRAISRNAQLPSPRDFLARRAVRLLPAYWVALAGLHLTVDDSNLASIREALTHAALWQNFQHGAVFRGILVGWTLAIEISFYLLVAIALVALARLGFRARVTAERWLIGAMLVLPYAVRWWLLFQEDLGGVVVARWWTIAAIPVSLPWWSDTFAVGMLIARCVARESVGDVSASKWVVWSPVAVVSGAIAIEATGVFGSFRTAATSAAMFWDIPARTAVAGVIVASIAFGPATRFARSLSTAWLCWIGTISYGIYLWHHGIIREVDGLARFESSLVLPVAIALALSVGVAVLSWYALERPLIRALRARQRRAQGAVSAP